MVRNVAAACAAALALCMVSGCGTCINMVSNEELWSVPGVAPRSVYGGVRNDVQISRMAVDQTGEGNPLAPVAGLLALIDLPISVICDTLTLPYILYVNASKRESRQAQDSSAMPTAAFQPASP